MSARTRHLLLAVVVGVAIIVALAALLPDGDRSRPGLVDDPIGVDERDGYPTTGPGSVDLPTPNYPTTDG